MYKQKIAQTIAEIEAKLIEREELIRLCVLAMFSKHHMFLIGVPGVGKTYSIQIISKMIEDATYWEKLLSKETSEKDLVGNEETPIEETILAHPFIFFDEMFKAPDELLVSLLSLLNERYFTIKGKAKSVPLSTLFSASNELPFGEKIEPFSDRLLIWYEVNRIQKKENKEKFIRGQFNKNKKIENTFTLRDIEEVCNKAKKIEIPDEISDTYFKIQNELIRSNIQASDRKFGSDYIIRALRVSAVLNDRTQLDYSDLLFVRFMSWTNYLERNKLSEIIDNVLFGDKDKIEGLLIKIIDFFNKKHSDFDRECFKFINYHQKIDPQIFQRLMGLCLNFQSDMNLALLESKKIAQSYDLFLLVKKQEKDNVLLCPSKFNPFSNQTLSALNEITVSIEFQIKKIGDFINDNPDSYRYEQNQFLKGVKQ